ncbi:MAG TPA: AmmeMemoRadiSam system protein B, partial [Armatimonadota bacterium]|nr:AmmeMemoRadiSam system protein B [Armatimonadota bacterium]
DGRPAGAVILGVNHARYYTADSALALSSAAGWATPLGVMPVARELGGALRALDADVGVDDLSHAHEHSLEVQVPFLQYLFGELPILPIAVGHTTRDAVLALGMALATLCAAHDLLLIASTDFSHQVPAEVARERDALALDRIRAVDPLGLLAVVAARDISMCGSLPTAIALVAAKAMGVEDGAVLHYHTSGDVTGDTRQVVGYGAVALQKRQRSKRS